MTETQPDLDFQVLLAAHMASLKMIPFSKDVSAVVDDLLDKTVAFQLDNGTRDRRPKVKDTETLKSTIGALLGDLLEASMNEDAEGWCWRLSDRAKFKGSRATSRHYDGLYHTWPLMGLMEVAPGYSFLDDFDGEKYRPKKATHARASRLRATPLLLSKLTEHGITPVGMSLHFKRDWKTEVPILLRAKKMQGRKKGERLEYTKTAFTDRLEQEVREINEYLAEWKYSFGAPPVLFRVFNDGKKNGYEWDRGGRLNTGKGGYLGLPKAARSDIQINHEDTVQIDISACQLTILHGLFGVEFKSGTDPYAIDGMDREEVKGIVNHIVGLGRLPKDGGSRARDKVIGQFPFLRNLEEHGYDTLSLQAIESNVMCRTLLTLKREHHIPALQVFDCLIVRQRDLQIARDVFGQTFFDEVGVWPTLEIE